MYITYITLVLHLLHALQSILICITHYKCNVWAGNLLNLHEDYRGRPSTWYVCCFLPSLGAESRWDDRGGNSKSVRNTELMMECNDCLFEGWNEKTATTHLEVWPDKSEVETHIVRAAHINDKPEGDKMLGDPGNCHHCLCPASHWLNPERSWPAKRGITRFRRRPGFPPRKTQDSQDVQRPCTTHLRRYWGVRRRGQRLLRGIHRARSMLGKQP